MFLLRRASLKGTPQGGGGQHKRDTTGERGDNTKGTPQGGDNIKETPQERGGTTQKGHHTRGDNRKETPQERGGTTQKGHHKRDTTGGTTGDSGGGQQGAPCIPINQFSQLFKMMKIHMFVILNLYTNFQYENIMTTKICYDKMNVFIQNLQEIGTSTLSKMLKTLNAHNFLNSYQKILILHFKKIALIQRNPTKEEFLQFYLTSSHNYSK